ncbi:hypothetical protein J3458_019805 [Metarhizium acridum]|uniref:uncharacterized protein n=1 Tax=Metarhizium acridum TaxID=92637 RepID=UPI001C6B8065|nr:hypothetical protein J3458_019805 [Metarhizium acridum]
MKLKDMINAVHATRNVKPPAGRVLETRRTQLINIKPESTQKLGGQGILKRGSRLFANAFRPVMVARRSKTAMAATFEIDCRELEKTPARIASGSLWRSHGEDVFLNATRW